MKGEEGTITLQGSNRVLIEDVAPRSHDGRWKPKKRLTRYQMEHLRTLRHEDPDTWTDTKLSETFRISPSSVKRILRSKFEPSPEVQERQDTKALKQREERLKKYKHTHQHQRKVNTLNNDHEH